MEYLIHKSSLLLAICSSIFLMACDKLPVNFGLRVEDSQGRVIDCNDQSHGFGIEVPYFVETEQKVVLKYKGEGVAKWQLQTKDQVIEVSGVEVSVEFPGTGEVTGSMQATSICNTEETHNFNLNVIQKLGKAHLTVNSGKTYTNKSQVNLDHKVTGATAMLIATNPNCSGDWVDYSEDSIKSLVRANGNNHYYAKFKNQVRESSCVGASVVHDNIAPVVRLSNMPAKNSNLKNINFSASAIDSLSGVAHVLCSIDGENYQNCNSTVVRNNISEGPHLIRVYASDIAGNVSELFTYDFILDHSAPSLSFSEVPEVYNTGGQQSYNFLWNGDASKGDKILCNMGDGFKVCDKKESLNAMEETTYNVVAYAIDAVGNESEHITHSFTVDKTGPTTKLTSSPSSPTLEKNASFSFQSNDTGIGNTTQYCSLNSKPYQICDSKASFSDLPNQFHEFKVYAVDGLGNRGNEVKYRWEVDDGIVSEEFLVGEAVKSVDIVVVIDNSSSMDKEQKEMGDRFGNFVSSLSGLDWRMGIITTNADHDNDYAGGRLLNFTRKYTNKEARYVISSEDEDAEELFKSSIRVDQGGNDTEEGVRALRKFLNRDDSAMLRDEAHFATIIISDEDEKSRGSNLRDENKPENLVAAIQEKFNGNKVYSNHSIIYKPGDTKCDRRGGKYEGHTYNFLSELTDGIVGSICESNYTNQLLSIGDRIQETAFSVGLKCIPKDTNGDGEADVSISYLPEPAIPIQYKIRKDKLVLSPYPKKGTKVRLVYRCPKD